MKLLVCLSVLVVVTFAKRFSYKSCSPNSPVSVTSLVVTPDPVSIPGKVTWDILVDIPKNYKDASMTIKLVRNTFLLDVTLPCVDNIGSCSYSNMCKFVDAMIGEDWAGIGKGIGDQLMKITNGQVAGNILCNKGLGPGKLNSKRTLSIPKLPKMLSFLAAGSYTVTVELRDTKDNSVISCTEAKFELEDNISIWGKRRRRQARLSLSEEMHVL